MRRAGWGLALVPLVLALSACSSGGSSGGHASPPATSSLAGAGRTVQAAMSSYLANAGDCAKQTSPVVCLEAADRKLGNAIHTYANLLAVGHGFAAPRADLTTTRDAAQTLANSLEILGDAQPTQANYDQVLNTFDVKSAISQLQGDVTTLGHALGP
jgi:hypothetical protein